MKKIAIYISVLITLGACNKNILDRGPLDKYSDQNVWKDMALVNMFVANIYANMKTPYDEVKGGNWMMANITDEAISSRTFHDSRLINTLQYNEADDVYKDVWDDGFKNIRKCNLLLSKIPEITAADNVKRQLKGEAHFLRAFTNLDIYMHFGRFPITDKVLALEDETTIPRSTAADCIKFILADLDTAGTLLPEKYGPADLGRATRWAAVAIRSRFLLNLERYQEASDSSLKVINSKQYSLFPDYQTLFNPENDNNSEIIFDKQYGSAISKQTHDMDTYESSTFYTGFASAITCPTQNLVDAFEMKDGLSWDKSPLYNTAKPYDNRDPRFYATVMYDGISWMGETVDMKKGSKFNRATGSGSSPTSYFLRKFLNPKYDHKNPNNIANFQNCAIIRLADVYLIYAEAQFKLGHPEEARKYVNLVRQRVKMPDITAADFSFSSIQHERQVELAMEGQRWYDIRRWKKGQDLIGAKIYGIDIQDGTGGRKYVRMEVEQRKFEDKMYLFPIPLSERLKYPASNPLEQNQGW